MKDKVFTASDYTKFLRQSANTTLSVADGPGKGSERVSEISKSPITDRLSIANILQFTRSFQRSIPLPIVVPVPIVLLSPQDISSLALWLDGSDANSIIGTVLQDKSGTSRNSTQNLGVTIVPNRINNLSAFSWPRLSRAYGNAAFTSGNNLTFFYLGTVSSSSDSFGRIFTLYTVGPNTAGDSSPTLMKVNNGNNNLNIDGIDRSITFDVPFLVSITYATGSKVTCLNGSIIDSGTATYTFNHPQYGLATDPRNIACSVGTMGETIIYVGSLSSTQRQQIEGYLAWKWGVQADLPSNHPYKNAAPTK